MFTMPKCIVLVKVILYISLLEKGQKWPDLKPIKSLMSSPHTPTIYLLKDTAYPCYILSIVGARKSRLLDILAAGTSRTSVTLLLNSLPLPNPLSFCKLSAYVPQHDSCLSQLTFSELFAFSARLHDLKLAWAVLSWIRLSLWSWLRRNSFIQRTTSFGSIVTYNFSSFMSRSFF